MPLAKLMLCGQLLVNQELTAICETKKYNQKTDMFAQFKVRCDWGVFKHKGQMYAFKVDLKTGLAEGRCNRASVFWQQ